MDKEAQARITANQNAMEGAETESMGATMAPPEFSLTADDAVDQHIESNSPEVLEIRPGELTATGEGNDAATRYIHWPETTASGVTLGKGYDIGSRTAEQVIADLTAAGMELDQATKISAGAGLTGDAAGTFVTNNKDDIGEIPSNVQYALLATMIAEYQGLARDRATNTVADGNNSNAAGREAKEGAEAGTYVMTDEQWDGLHPAMLEFLTDLRYQGGYYGFDRVARINEILIAHDGDALAQFEGVAGLFEAGEEDRSYMDNYGVNIGEGVGNTETFYGQTVEDLAGATTRRNRIRLAYLRQIITALRANQEVRVVLPENTEN